MARSSVSNRTGCAIPAGAERHSPSCGGVILRSGFLQPLDGLRVILLHAAADAVQQRQLILRFSVAFLGLLLFRAGQLLDRIWIILIGRLAEPRLSLLSVFLDALPFVKKCAQLVLGGSDAAVGRLAEEFRRFLVVLLHPRAVAI